VYLLVRWALLLDLVHASRARGLLAFAIVLRLLRFVRCERRERTRKDDESYCTIGKFVFKVYSRRKHSVATRRDWFLELFLGSVSELIMLFLFFIVIYFNTKTKSI
jgi:hypothetical protein